MAKTLAQLRQAILVELGEDALSQLAELPSGDDDTPDLTSDANITRLLNDAKDEVCRTAYLYRCSAAFDVAAGDGPEFALSGLAVSGVKEVRAALALYWQPDAGSQSVLTWLSWEALLDNFPNHQIAPAGTPKYWSRWPENPRVITVYKKPNADGTLTVTGYAIPDDLSADGDEVSWLPDDRYRVLVCYVCAMLCRKGMSSDDFLTARLPLFRAEYDRNRLEMRGQIRPDLAAEYLDPMVPLSIGA